MNDIHVQPVIEKAIASEMFTDKLHDVCVLMYIFSGKTRSNALHSKAQRKCVNDPSPHCQSLAQLLL